MRISILIIFFLALLSSSCKNENTSQVDTSINETYTKSLNAYNQTPNKNTGQLLISEIRKELKVAEDVNLQKDLLLKGLKVAEDQKLGSVAVAFLMPLVKDHAENKEEHLAKLSSALLDIGQNGPGDILANAYLKSFPNGKYKELIEQKRTSQIEDVDKYLLQKAEVIFENPDQFGINRLNAQKYVDACEAYALAYPDKENTPEYLYKGAEMARTLKTYGKCLNIYDWILTKYPDYAKAPTTMFLKGFMLENELGDKKAAKTVYEDFIKKYPESDLNDDVNFLLQNIDKSEEEIMKMIEEKK